MAARMSECLLCGREYEVCKLCPRVKEFTPWRINYDSPRHFQIHFIVQEIRDGILTNEEAKEQLEALGVTADEVSTFVESVQATLNPVMGIVEKKKHAVKKEAEVEAEPKAEPQEPQQEQPKALNRFKGRKK